MSEIFGNGIMGGGGLTNSKLALADAQPEDVRSGKKFYSGDKQIKTGTNPDVAQATPTITVDTAGKITAAATQTAGIVPAGTKSATKQLTIQAGKTVTPSISAQTAVASQRFTTGDVKVAAVNGIIRVTYPAGDTCTCKNGSTTLTANASDGVTVFIVPNTGTWTLTVTNGTKTATKTVSITATSRFANVTLAYFTATLNITYPAKSTCVIKNSSGAQVKSDTNTTENPRKWTTTVDATGTYTITATATDGSGKTKSTTVSITANGQVETVVLTYEFFIFKNGSGLTSGYSVAGSGGNVSKNSISWSGSSSDGGISVYIKPAVVLKDYTKLCFDFECSYNYGGNYGMGFGVGKDAAASTKIDWTQWTAKVTNGANPIARNTAQCDISALTDSEYIKVVGSYSAGKIYNIWLE